MKVAPIVYDTQAEAPTFSRFVAQIMCERQELVDYLQRVLGCALTGDVSEQVWHLLVGEGENGKSTLMELIAAVMGDYAGGLEPESITMSGRPRDGSEASPDIAELKGKRFVTVTETEAGARIAAARIKKLCGGDAIQARKLRRDVFTFRPTHKLFIYTNHVPQASETTHAFWRRVRYIPFDFSLRTLPETAKDKDLPVKLRAEAAGVLAWLVAGCLAWQREGGLHPPQAVIEATAAYRDEMDVLGQFLKECCVEREGVSARAGALWETFKAWAEETGQGRGISRKKMGMALKERGYQREHTRAGEVWHGLGLLTDTATQTTLATAPAPTSAPAPATDVKGVKDGEPFPRMTPYSGAVAPSLEKTVHHPSLFTHPSQSVGGNLSLVENGRKEEEDKETEKQKERNRANASPPAPANQTNQTNQTNQATGGTLKPFAQRYDELLAQGLSADAAVRLALAERGEVEVPDDPR